MRRGRVDLSLFGLPASAASGLAVHRLATTPYRVVLSEDHPLAQRTEIEVAEIAAEHFVDTPVGFGNRDVLDSALAARGIVRDIRAEVTETSAIPVFVATCPARPSTAWSRWRSPRRSSGISASSAPALRAPRPRP